MIFRFSLRFLGLVLGLSACTPAVAPLNFNESWSADDSAHEYSAVTRAWTRSAKIRAPLQDKSTLLLDVQATLRAQQWRNAYVSWQASTRKLSAADRNRLLEAQKEQAKKEWEIALVVSSYYRRHNDLHKGKRSIWQVTLTSSDRRFEAVSITRDRRPIEVQRAELLDVDDFAEVYLVKFPPDLPIEETKSATLIVAGDLGSAEMTWRGGD